MSKKALCFLLSVSTSIFMMKIIVLFGSFLVLVQLALAVSPEVSNSNSTNHLRVAVSGLKDSRPTLSKRQFLRADGEHHSVYEKGQVLPGGGVRKQYFFVSEDYIVYDGPRERVIPFFDPEKWMNCDCDVPFPLELDIPHRFALYNPVTVQAPLPSVPIDLLTVKYTGHYYACPAHINPFEFAWYFNKQEVSPCKWIWYQSSEDATANLREK